MVDLVQTATQGSTAMAPSVYDYVHDLKFNDLSPEAVVMAKRLVLDLYGVALGGAQTDMSRIIRDHAAGHFGGCHARMLLDGRRVSAAGAALAGGITIDALDGHDGQKLTKGHVGCGVFPSVLALMEAQACDDPREMLTALVAGYEIGTRAGIALHRTASEYHTSGAWVALACAALGARALGLTQTQTREAMGIAEYHGPRSQMMRCIDHPTMVKDGSGWGAMAGVSAAYLAADGFTGAPAITVDSADVADIWGDLGARHYVFEQYIKLYPVCRWAQPPLQAVLGLRQAHGLVSADVDHIEVTTFHQSVRLATRLPKTTEEAQYSTAYPTAVAMVHGRVGAQEVSQAAFGDAEVQRLAAGMIFAEDEAYNAAFPAHRFAHVTLVLRDGTRLTSERTEALGDPEAPLSAAVMGYKFHGLADQIIGRQRARDAVDIIADLDAEEGSMADLNRILYML
jgi:2-methylcitrate dehydratase PrpD